MNYVRRNRNCVRSEEGSTSASLLTLSLCLLTLLG